jgi:hypothetical protein
MLFRLLSNPWFYAAVAGLYIAAEIVRRLG